MKNPSPGKSWKKFLIKAAVFLAAILYLYFNLEWTRLVEISGRISLISVFVSTVIGAIGIFLVSWKYYCLLQGTDLQTGYLRVTAISFISRFYALFIPSGLGKEAVRWYKITENRKGRSFFLASIALERMIFGAMLMFFGTIPLFMITDIPEIVRLREQILPLILICYGAILTGMIYFFVPSVHEWTHRAIKRILRTQSNGRVDVFLQNFNLKNTAPRILLALILIRLLWQGVYVARIALLYQATGLDLAMIDVVWMSSLVLLIQVLPVSFAGLGVREGAFAFLLSFYGRPEETGVIIGLLFFVQMLVYCLAGAVLNIFEK